MRASVRITNVLETPPGPGSSTRTRGAPPREATTARAVPPSTSLATEHATAPDPAMVGTAPCSPTTAFESRSVKTTARLADGQVLAIGGLISRQLSDARAYTPWLHRVPLLGWLWKSYDENDEDLELVVVVSPTILRERDETVGCLSLAERVVQLHEVERFAGENLFHRPELAWKRGRHPDISSHPLSLRLANRLEVDRRVAEVVDLIEVDGLTTPRLEGARLLGESGCSTAAGRNLRGEEQIVLDAQLLGELAGHGLRPPV